MMVIIVETVKMTLMLGIVIMMVMMVVKMVAHKLVATVLVMLALKAMTASVLRNRSE